MSPLSNHPQRYLITGVATADSIAYAVARRCLDDGARVVLSAHPRELERVQALAEQLGVTDDVLSLDLTAATDLAQARATLGESVGHLDGVLHAVAFAPPDALSGRLTDADPAGVELAFRTSAWSLAALGGLLEDLRAPTGGSLVGLDFDAGDRAWSTYNWMGVCKAALRSCARYLARDLGPLGLRVNLVAAGPLRTRAASAIPGFEQLVHAWETTAPLAWSVQDPEPVADAVCFLLSDAARAITGEVLHVDGGFHAMAMARDEHATPTTSVATAAATAAPPSAAAPAVDLACDTQGGASRTYARTR
ncbi:MAG: SDR family oxidoreductase [Acidimicrobiia bacterium]|nr:SDR family oxidoreductase [Acidimicrobiia bacterium]